MPSRPPVRTKLAPLRLAGFLRFGSKLIRRLASSFSITWRLAVLGEKPRDAFCDFRTDLAHFHQFFLGRLLDLFQIAEMLGQKLGGGLADVANSQAP